LEELTHALDEFRNRCVLIKRRRNRELAHMDLATLLRQYGYANEVPITVGPSRQEIEEALAALRNFMNLIQGHCAETLRGFIDGLRAFHFTWGRRRPNGNTA
jgi:translation elongation factor EF-Tu-like GTPase